jgi:predicted acyl esterase
MRVTMRAALLPALAMWCFGLVAPVAPSLQSPDLGQHYTALEIMVPMRDGRRLHTAVYVPKNAKGPLPFVLLRTPYGIDGQVQSSWFPLIDRNPQKYVPNIFEAKDADYQAAQQRVFRSPQYPSHVVLPVLRGAEKGKDA